ncbi:MAG: GGDEF domain-containing protein [Firmicutes bacterium]|nr:GGDEF domain-containing protein [Bacillota bacterium]
MYFANIVAGVLWIKYVSFHLKLRLHPVHTLLLKAITAVGSLLILVNLFVPILFTITDNVYERGMLYKAYMLMAAVCLVDSIALYMIAKKSGGLLKFFPIAVFIVPAAVGISLQFFIYGISTIWLSLAISIAGIMTASKNEIIFMDRLTGIYNRSYLDHLQKQIQKRKDYLVSGIMIDLNGFKSINDRLGHAVGDDALITAARIFSDVVNEKGCAIRYAGDEFVILLNTADTQLVQNVILQIRNSLEEHNNRGEKPYVLSASMGFAVFDLRQQSISMFMNIMDMRMYEDKARYYTQNPEMDRRRSR